MSAFWWLVVIVGLVFLIIIVGGKVADAGDHYGCKWDDEGFGE